MTDLQYKETKRVLDYVQKEDWSFLHQDLQDSLEELFNETDNLLSDYEEKLGTVEELESEKYDLECLLSEHNIEY